MQMDSCISFLLLFYFHAICNLKKVNRIIHHMKCKQYKIHLKKEINKERQNKEGKK